MFVDVLAHPDLEKYDLSSLRKGKVVLLYSYCPWTLMGVARWSWGARDSPLYKPFLSKQPTIYRGVNAMTILFEPVCDPPPPPLKNPGYAPDSLFLGG